MNKAGLLEQINVFSNKCPPWRTGVIPIEHRGARLEARQPWRFRDTSKKTPLDHELGIIY
jgi:hypothetical protein